MANQLQHLANVGANNENKFQLRLAAFAQAASVQSPGPLDDSNGALRYLSGELKLLNIRHYKYGRHRYYITGQHSDCRYNTWMIKEFKQDGHMSEGGSDFDRAMRKALNDPPSAMINPYTGECLAIEMQENQEGEDGEMA